MTHYDLAIIGSGSGNSVITGYWDDKKVALIDGGIFGGTCLNVGCIPTKMYVYPAQLAASATEAKKLGVDLEFKGADWVGIRDRIFGRIDAISAGGRRYRDVELEHVDLYSEYASFTGEKELTTASGAVITADNIVVASGSRAVLPQVPGIDLAGVHTSDTIMRLDELPERIVIVGGGYIASEFAAVFSGLGSSVTQVNRSGALMRHQDVDISTAFTKAASARWNVELDAHLTGIRAADAGLVVAFEGKDGKKLELEADVVLVAAGRVPNTDTLNVAGIGLDQREDGTLLVDEYQRLLRGGEPVPDMFAMGDVANQEQLKHVANRETRVVVHNMENPSDLRPMDRRAVAAAVFTNPQIATVGLTEAEARTAYPERELAVAIQEYGSTAYGWAMDDTEGIVKVIADQHTGEILGGHIMGHEASLLIQPLIQAMVNGTTVAQLARGPYWIHPALTEVVENALLSLGVDAHAGDPL